MIKEIDIMSVNYFTNEQVEQLRKNRYVKNVSNKAITYSDDFKELFLIQYDKKSVSTIFKDAGFNPQVLGSRRINSFTYRIKQQAKRIDGISDTRKTNSGRPCTRDLTDAELIEKLKYQNNILKQENDFLKRVKFINKKHLSKQ